MPATLNGVNRQQKRRPSVGKGNVPGTNSVFSMTLPPGFVKNRLKRFLADIEWSFYAIFFCDADLVLFNIPFINNVHLNCLRTSYTAPGAVIVWDFFVVVYIANCIYMGHWQYQNGYHACTICVYPTGPKICEWYQSLTAHQRQKGYTVPKQG